jgi:2-polyprenyl-3-methyl-5-hydroxy-6-metoxy-1,4-benzoquinol methylase
VLPYLSGNVLDFGCGRGNLADFLPSSRYLGADFDEESLQIARSSHPQHRFDRSVGTERSFDSIALLAVIEHIEHPLELLDVFDSVLKEGGISCSRRRIQGLTKSMVLARAWDSSVKKRTNSIYSCMTMKQCRDR